VSPTPHRRPSDNTTPTPRRRSSASSPKHQRRLSSERKSPSPVKSEEEKQAELVIITFMRLL